MSEATTTQPDSELGQGPRPGQLEFSPQELLASHAYEEPLIAGGVKCHGGFRDGVYGSPRTLYRSPAIEAWQRRLIDDDQPLLHLPTRYVPPHYPNYPQARLLLQEGVRDPVTRSLTIVSIVEGFGARIRELPLPDLETEVAEPLDGTCLAHLASGLFEAHARDEAGHRDEGGHKQMWEAARDLGLDRPEIPDDVLMKLMMGGGGRRERRRLFPQLSERMEGMIAMMGNVMVVEVFAEDVFEWAKQLLGDPEVSADPKAAAAMVAHIQADEKPHVEYLRTALSELRARTLRSPDGKYEVAGSEVIDTMFAHQLRGMATSGPRLERDEIRDEIHHTLADQARASQLARQFEDLDSGWTFPHADDEPLDVPLKAS